MEKTVKRQRIIIVLLAVLLIFNLFSLQDIGSRIENLESNIGYRFENISQNINGIYNEIADIYDEAQAKASLITSFEYEYGEPDIDKMTVPVSVEIIPKSIAADTALFLEFGKRSVEMKRNGSAMLFTAEFELDVFEQNDGLVMLVMKSEGTSQTQELEWYINDLRSEVLPFASAYFHSADIICGEKSGITVDGTVSVIIQDESEDSIKNAKLIYKMNGETVDEENVVDDDFIHIHKTFTDYGIGDTFELYFEAEDSFGFVHETMLKTITFEEYGKVESEAPEDLDEIIKDKNGNVLYP